MYKKYMVLLFVGVCIAALSISAAAEEETKALPPRSDEPFETDRSAEKEYDNIVGEDLDKDTPHILDMGKNDEEKYENVVGEDCDQDTPHILGTDEIEENDKETLNNDLSAGTTTDDIENASLSIPVILIVAGIAGLVLLVAVKRK